MTAGPFLIGPRMRGLLRDWNRYWLLHPEAWYDARFNALPVHEQGGVLEAIERVKEDMTLIMNAFRENR